MKNWIEKLFFVLGFVPVRRERELEKMIEDERQAFNASAVQQQGRTEKVAVMANGLQVELNVAAAARAELAAMFGGEDAMQRAALNYKLQLMNERADALIREAGCRA